MEYKYDPILCMNIPVEKKKAKDAKTMDENYIISGMKSQLEQMLKRYKNPKNKNQLVSQYIGVVNNHRANGKVTEEEFKEFVKYAKGLVGGSARDSISGSEYKDSAPAGMRDSDSRFRGYINSINSEKDIEIAKKLVKRSEYDGGITDAEYEKIVNVFKKKFGKAVDKAIKACDEERKIGEFGGIKYEITENSDGSFNIKLNGQPHKNHARFSSLREAEKNVQMNIGEILSYERATGKKALIRNFA